MNEPKIKFGEKYYLVLHKRDWTYKPAVIVEVTAIRSHGRGDRAWIVAEQKIDGITHQLTVHIEWLAPYNIKKAQDLLHNMRMWEHRWEANNWRHRLNYKTAKNEVLKALAKLPKKQQQKIWQEFKKVYPNLLKTDTSIKSSKTKMTQWDELAWAIIASKYPLKEVW
jgi:hypothetical protein